MLKGKHVSALRVSIVTVALVAALGPSAALHADSEDATPVFHNIGTVTQPAVDAIKAGVTATNPTGKFASFDISWVDNKRNVYYLADRSNNAVDAIDARDGSFIRYLGHGLFSGVVAGAPNRSGPDGVVTDQHGNVWVGDGHPATGGTSSLKELNPNTGVLIKSIDTGGAARSDELAFGNVAGGRILIANPNEPTTAFTTLVNTQTQSIIGKVFYDQTTPTPLPAPGHGFATNFGTTQHGLEQPAFFNGHFYLNVPATIQNTGGEIDVYGANAAQITAIFPLTTCGGTGLGVGRNSDLFVECGDSLRVLDANNGTVRATYSDLGGADEIWFNPGDGNVYVELNAKGGVGVLDTVHKKTFFIPVAGTQGAHSVAAAAHGNRVFVPISDNPDNGAGGIVMLRRAGARGDNE